MRWPKLKNANQLAKLVDEIGFLPFFACEIEGYSVEEHTPDDYWFQEDVEGPWEWKNDIALSGEIAYGKLFHNKAGYVSKRWYPILANYRRQGYDFDARYDDELASYKDKQIMDLLMQEGSMLSTDIRKKLNYHKGGNKGFETIITRLQMQTYITVQDFEYKKDKHGEPYGWGVARYVVSEKWLGKKTCSGAYKEDPETSYEKIIEHLVAILPRAEEDDIRRLMR